MADERKRPPYTSARDLDQFFARIKSIGDPGTIDTKWVASYNIASSQPEGVVSALKWLGVIDGNGKSLGVWNELRVPATRAATLTRLMNEAYADVFSSVDVAEASREDLEGAFISAYSSGNPGRPIGCFLALCAHAGIETNAAGRSPRPASPSGAGSAPSTKTATTTDSKPAPTRTVSSNPSPRKRSADINRHAPITVSLKVEIPADWSEDQVRQRIEAVRRALGDS